MNSVGVVVLSKTWKEEKSIHLGLNICCESLSTEILSEFNIPGVGELPVEVSFQDFPTEIPARVIVWFAYGIDPIRI